ncbi:vomeronasal type-2 receptor 26-like [Protopterus annectens]|uniref:vomeronasal type-2 receptor 26-like n=1 Tax=Protopterus annectens TaxID=7888 RepID=UPI001CF9810B|nr:vomeronasal type-2 receptor 26-like [Protopterus annectens]
MVMDITDNKTHTNGLLNGVNGTEFCNVVSIDCKYVINLSGYELSDCDIGVLDRGLKFVPTVLPRLYELRRDVFCFNRKFNLLDYYSRSVSEDIPLEDVSDNSISSDDSFYSCHSHEGINAYCKLNIEAIKVKSDFMPPQRNDSITNFNVSLTYNVEKEFYIYLKHKNDVRYNMDKKEWECLNKLSRKMELIFKLSNKGGKLVVLNYMQYLKMCYKHLNDEQVFHYVRNVRFRNKAGDLIFFDENGESRARYDIINWQAFPDGSLRTPLVGGYDSWALDGHELTINSNIIMWNTENKQVPRSMCSESCSPGYRKATRRGEPLCCFDCVPCAKGEISNHTDCVECFHCPEYYWPNDRKDNCIPKPIEFLSYVEPLGVSLCTSTIITCLLCSCILCIFIMNRNTPIVKANNRYLSYVLLLGLMFCCLCSFIFIGYPMKLTCMLRQSAFGVIFSISVSCILAKTITVVIAFNATNPASKLRNWVGSEIPNSVIFVGSSVQFLICITWLISCTPFPNLNMESEEGKIIVECNECSVVAFWCMLGFLGFLATVSFAVAFLSRKLPDSFNEAKYITFTMLMFVSVWLSFVPAYLSTRGKYMVAVEVFAIISSTAAMLGCIFFPKCYIILLRPELNSKEYLIGKSGISSKAL